MNFFPIAFMPSGFTHRSGPQECENMNSTAAIITAGDAVKNSSGSCLTATSGTKVEGIMTSATIAAAITAVQILRCQVGRTRFQAFEKRASGSLAATDGHSLHDLTGTTGAQGFDSSATSHNDIFIDKVLATGASNTGSAIISFGDPTWLTAAVV